MADRSKVDEFIREAVKNRFHHTLGGIISQNLSLLRDFYKIAGPIYAVYYIANEEGRPPMALFGYCGGEKDAIKSLLDHESSYMGSREDIVSFFEVDPGKAVEKWISSIDVISELVKEYEGYLSTDRYPRQKKEITYTKEQFYTTKESDERMLKHWKDELGFLREVGPVYQIKPADQVQRCPRCWRRVQNGMIIKEDRGKIRGEL